MVFFRASFLLLILANLAFFAWAQGYFGGAAAGREPQRLGEQLAADKLRIVATGPAALASAPICRLVTGVPPTAVDALRAALGEGISVDARPVEESPSYWVHLPPQQNKAAAEKKAAELRQLGIKDFYIVQDEGPARFSISLALFKSDAAASEFVQGLAKRGVRTARVEVREKPVQQVRAIVRGGAASVNQRLPAALAAIPGATAAECPTP